MSQYKLIIFDFDGTLAITHKAIIYCFTKTFENFKIIPPAADTIIGTIGINLPNTFKILHPAIEESAIPEWVETYRSYYRTEGEKQVDLFPGTKQILQLVSKSGLSLGVFSNKQVSFVGSSVLIVLIFQENAKEVMPVFQNLLNFSNQSHTFLIALI